MSWMKNSHGGWRPGAGRKPKGDVAGVPHVARASVSAKYPVHIRFRLDPSLPSLRKRGPHQVVRDALEIGSDRFGFRVVHYRLNDHEIQFLVESPDNDVMQRGLKGLAIRIARTLNRFWNRKGHVFSDRYEDRVLRTPEEVRETLVEMLAGDARKPDPYSSGDVFDGWKDYRVRKEDRGGSVVAEPRSTLLKKGWKQVGLLLLKER